MQTIYTAQTLLSELQTNGVILQPTADGNLFLDGEMSDAQFLAVKELKPQIVYLISQNQVFLFGSNEYLFNNFEGCFRIFDSSNESAIRFIEYLRKVETTKSLEINFNQPTSKAYKAELKLAAAIEKAIHNEDNLQNLRQLSDEFIKTHNRNCVFADWMIDETPLFTVKIFFDQNETDYLIGNAVQSAIFCLYHKSVNSQITYKIERA